MKSSKPAAMKKSMKPAMKKVMKSMKKAMKVSKIARGIMAKSQVLKGRREKTVGGLAAKDLMKNKNGRVVSKKKHAAGMKQPWMVVPLTAAALSLLRASVKAARKSLGITGFCPVGGKSPEGKALYAK